MKLDLGIKKAVRGQRKAKILLAAPAGGGKTYSALSIAQGLKGESGRVLLLDTENSSSTLYADEFGFDHANLPDTAPATYVAALTDPAVTAYDVVILDSASHLWQYLLDKHKKMQGNSFANWGKLGFEYEPFVEAVVKCPTHLIVTTRAKMKYEQGSGGKVEPIGLEPVIRDGFEYEVDIYGMIDIDHNMTIRKTRIAKFADKIISKPGTEFGKAVREWLDSGEAPPPPPTPLSDPGQHALECPQSKAKGKRLVDIVAESPDWLKHTVESEAKMKSLTEADRVNILAFFNQLGAKNE